MRVLRDGDDLHSAERAVRAKRDTSEDDVYRALAATLHVLARRLERLLEEDPPHSVRADLERTRALTNEIVDSLRTVTTAIGIPPSRRASVATALRRLSKDFTRATGTSVDVRVDGSSDELPEELVDVLFGVACEAFLNIERHARATSVVVSVRIDERRVVLDLRDDGVDLAHREAYESNRASTGLATATALVGSVGGRVALSSAAPRGVRLVADIPRP